MNIKQDLKFQLASTWVSILLYLHGSDCLPTDGGHSTINKGGGQAGGATHLQAGGATSLYRGAWKFSTHISVKSVSVNAEDI